MVWLAVALVLLLGGAYAADRIVLARTIANLEEQIRAGLPEVSSDLSIDVDGVLFLPQVIGGTLDRAQISASSARINDLYLQDIHLELRQVSVREPYGAQAVNIDASAPGSTVATAVQAAGVPEQITVTVQDSQLLAQASVLGAPAQVVLVPEAAGRAIEISLGQVSLAGAQLDIADLPEVIVDGLSGIEVELDQLPAGIQVQDIELDGEQMHLHLQGRQVVFEDL